MNPFHNIDPALDNSTTPNPSSLTNQFISQDGSAATDGNTIIAMPAGEPVQCPYSLSH